MKEEYSTVLNVIDEMTTYFSKLNNEHESKLQEYKAKLFEINIKLDELVKTQNVYSLNVDYRKNIFSPIDFEPKETEKESEIRNFEIRNQKFPIDPTTPGGPCAIPEAIEGRPRRCSSPRWPCGSGSRSWSACAACTPFP